MKGPSRGRVRAQRSYTSTSQALAQDKRRIQRPRTHAPRERLQGATLHQLFLRRPNAEHPIDLVLKEDRMQQLVVRHLSEVPKSEAIKALLGDLDRWHSPEAEAMVERRQAERANANERHHKNRARPDYAVGDYVLVLREIRPAKGKLLGNWKGPRRVVDVISDWIISVEHLATGVITQHHASRVKPFQESLLNTRQDLQELSAYTDGGYDMEAFVDLRRNAGQYEALVRWVGFDATEDSWEPIRILFEDAPAYTVELLRECQHVLAPAALTDINQQV